MCNSAQLIEQIMKKWGVDNLSGWMHKKVGKRGIKTAQK